MRNYIPFLKAKTNEFSSLKNLDDDISKEITPFFDIPRKNKVDYTEGNYTALIDRIVKKISGLVAIPLFYIDDYDIEDSLFVSGVQSYQYVMLALREYAFIPVIGINRSDERNAVVFDNSSIVKTKTVAIRVGIEDIQSGLLDINALVEEAQNYYSAIELIIDLRVVGKNDNTQRIINTVISFLKKSTHYSKIIITGSSIPTSSGSVVAPNELVDLERKELQIQRVVNLSFPDLFYGDYTIISPNYSDISIDPRIIPNIMTARIIYSYSDRHYIIRGVSIRKAGYGQYKDFCQKIKNKSFFRGSAYSFGDCFIDNADKMSKTITASTILNPMINAHITYMYKDFTF